ncbi:hypothetical protein [Sphingomonas sp.]|uniref:hypothetical protein n=1 Tax=Sphingomonas sp. TaxID=28214 RepID=UPI002DF5F746|nr:hypothetical protein [Sphingomonas sp.]
MISDSVYLRQQAERCRRLAADCSDARTAHSLRLMAEDYTSRAAAAAAREPVEFMLVETRQG